MAALDAGAGLAHRLQLRNDLAASRDREGTARVEAAAGRRGYRTRRFASHRLADMPAFRIGDRDRFHQRARIGMRGLGEDALGRSLLDDAAKIHDRDAIAEMFHDRQIVADENVRQTSLAL